MSFFSSMDQVLPCQQSYSTLFLSWAGESILSPIINRKSTLLTGKLSACLGCGRPYNWFNSLGTHYIPVRSSSLDDHNIFYRLCFLLLFHFIVILPMHDQITHLFYYMKLPPLQALPRVSGEHGTSEKRKKQMLRMSAEGSLFLG